MNTITKTYTRRDSATAYLRAAGVNNKDYDLFLFKLSDKEYVITIDADLNPVMLVASNVKPKTAVVKPAGVTTKLAKELAQAAKTTPVKKSVVKAASPVTKVLGVKTPTVASTARELVLAGKTNDQVFATLQKRFNLDDSKKNYPAWYRAECVRKGLLKV